MFDAAYNALSYGLPLAYDAGQKAVGYAGDVALGLGQYAYEAGEPYLDAALDTVQGLALGAGAGSLIAGYHKKKWKKAIEKNRQVNKRSVMVNLPDWKNIDNYRWASRKIETPEGYYYQTQKLWINPKTGTKYWLNATQQKKLEKLKYLVAGRNKRRRKLRLKYTSSLDKSGKPKFQAQTMWKGQKLNCWQKLKAGRRYYRQAVLGKKKVSTGSPWIVKNRKRKRWSPC